MQEKVLLQLCLNFAGSRCAKMWSRARGNRVRWIQLESVCCHAHQINTVL